MAIKQSEFLNQTSVEAGDFVTGYRVGTGENAASRWDATLLGSGGGGGTSVSYLYVSEDGNDSTGDGSKNLPWRSITKAVGQAVAGTIIVIGSGTYSPGTETVNHIDITRSGTADAPIVLQSESKWGATLDGCPIRILGASHIVLDGLNIVNAYLRGNLKDARAVAAYGYIDVDEQHPSQFQDIDGLTVINCRMNKTGSCAVAVQGRPYDSRAEDGGRTLIDHYAHVKNINISHNDISETHVGGGSNEQITIQGGCSNAYVGYNHLHTPWVESTESNPADGELWAWDRGVEGIDMKDGVQGGLIEYNTITDCTRKAIYLDGGRASLNSGGATVTRDIQVRFNDIRRCPRSSGINIQCERNGHLDDIQVYGNNIERVYKSGISLTTRTFGGYFTGEFRNIDIYNNVVKYACSYWQGYEGMAPGVNQPNAWQSEPEDKFYISLESQNYNNSYLIDLEDAAPTAAGNMIRLWGNFSYKPGYSQYDPADPLWVEGGQWGSAPSSKHYDMREDVPGARIDHPDNADGPLDEPSVDTDFIKPLDDPLITTDPSDWPPAPFPG